MREPTVYIRANVGNTTLYVGVTGHLHQRDYEHRTGRGGVFSSQYKTVKLVWYKSYQFMGDAIAMEKKLKAGSRKAKIKLIDEMNPHWLDLGAAWHPEIASSQAPRNDPSPKDNERP